MGLGNAKIQELYETAYPTLFRIACASGLGRTFADDMVQETFQTLLERRDDPKVAESDGLAGDHTAEQDRNRVAAKVASGGTTVNRAVCDNGVRL